MYGRFMNGIMVMKNKTGYTKVQIMDLDEMSFTDMSFFEERIPDNCELTSVSFYHDLGYYDEPDDSAIIINWRKKDA